MAVYRHDLELLNRNLRILMENNDTSGLWKAARRMGTEQTGYRQCGKVENRKEK